MTTSDTATSRPRVPGEPAPDFALPAVNGPDVVSLDQYRGRSPVFLALMLGLWCPFCRRQLVQLGKFEVKLKTLGIESVAVVATDPENARLYFKFRPTPLRLASDPDLRTHRAFGLPWVTATPELMQAMADTRINPFGDLPEPLPVTEIGHVMQQQDGYTYTPADERDAERQWPQLKALFLIDRDGIVRWSDIECSTEGLAGLGKFPSEAVILDAARACVA